jgi:hypothetical protein
MIDTSKDQPDFKIFHKAINAVETGGPDDGFSPSWMCLYEDSEGQRRQVLVGREKCPLKIDLDTLEVKVEKQLSCLLTISMRAVPFSRNGHLFYIDMAGVAHLTPPAKAEAPKREIICCVKHYSADFLPHLVPSGDHLYAVGRYYWVRIDLKTFGWERLTPDELPLPFNDFRNMWTSAHYQFIATDTACRYYEVNLPVGTENKPGGETKGADGVKGAP